MIKLYAFGRQFGLPDPSPFVAKVEMLLKLAELPYEHRLGDPRKAPKSKLPYIEDDGEVIADSTFIRRHLETRHGIDFDAGLDSRGCAEAWALEKMLEDHVYWLIVRERWMVDANFNKGPRQFFDVVPAMLRPVIRNRVRQQVRRDLYGQGLGRHSDSEIAYLAGRAFETLAQALGDGPYLMGETPCGADATAFSFIAGSVTELFEGPVRDAARSHDNLMAYRDRMMKAYYPELA